MNCPRCGAPEIAPFECDDCQCCWECHSYSTGDNSFIESAECIERQRDQLAAEVQRLRKLYGEYRNDAQAVAAVIDEWKCRGINTPGGTTLTSNLRAEVLALTARVKEWEEISDVVSENLAICEADVIYLERRLANAVLAARRWKELAQHAKEKLAELEQTTGDLCPVCGWSTVFPDGCSRCERSRLEATIEAARPVMRTVYVLRRGGWTAITLHKLCDLADNLPDDQRAKWEE